LIIYWIPASAGNRLEALRSFVFPAEAGIQVNHKSNPHAHGRITYFIQHEINQLLHALLVQVIIFNSFLSKTLFKKDV